MGLLWLWMVSAYLLVASCERGGSSLRGALEALQRRQRGRMHGPLAPQPDYDILYDYLPPQPQPYADVDYAVDLENLDEGPPSKYTVIKLLDENERPDEAYEYKIIKKKTASPNKKESAFRERSHHSDNDKLRELFMDRNEADERKDTLQEKTENDAEYARLLSELWSKYKNIKHHNTIDSAPQGVVKLYKDKYVKKRVPDNWGPIAFKRKRSSGSEVEHDLADYEAANKPHEDGMPGDPNYNAYVVSDEDKDDLREEYAIAFQPLDDDSFSDLSEDEQYSYNSHEKRFPVRKRSSGPYDFSKANNQQKRFAQDTNQRQTSHAFRSSSGTDPKILKDLSKIFGESEDQIMKKQVKRSSDDKENPNETYKPPQVAVLSHNQSFHDHNLTHNIHDTFEVETPEHHVHLHHPGLLAKEHDQPHEHTADMEKPISIKKKSIDWSDYFGIDKRKKKSVSFDNDFTEDKLKNQYFNTFNNEVIYPLKSFRNPSKVKRNFMQAKPSEVTEIQIDSTHAVASKSDEKRDTSNKDDAKLDNIDKKLRNMEDLIVDEALKYSNSGEELDSKEEQEMKEKLLSRLAAAYSLEKMRKALKEFKQSLTLQKHDANVKSSPVSADEAKAKRVAVKKEKVSDMKYETTQINKERSDDFEDEQGAGEYLNGRTDDQFSEGYMGGSGRHRFPEIPTVAATGSCPVLAKIVQRCRGVDLLAGDRGQLFLPLCSLHQICYLCGEAPPTTCDLVFLSEADTACEGDTGCQRAARSALMTLRELHDNLADELDGECEASPCLPATLKLNISWQRALQR